MPYYSSRREALKIIGKAAGFTSAVMACPALLGEVLADDGCEIERKVNSIVNYLGTRIRENKDYSNAHKLIDGYVNESTMQV